MVGVFLLRRLAMIYEEERGDYVYFVSELKIPVLPQDVIEEGRRIVEGRISEFAPAVVHLAESTICIKVLVGSIKGIARRLILRELRSVVSDSLRETEKFYLKRKLEIEEERL
jgi:hypothetical protein